MTRHDGAPPDMTGAHQPEDATVVYLPATRTDTPTRSDTSAPSAPEESAVGVGAVGTEVELAPAREAFNTRRLVPEQARERMAHGAVVVAHRAGPAVARGARGTARHAWHVVAGARVLARRWRDRHGASRYERMMQAAELEGNHERLLEWEARDVAEKQRRHDRSQDWLNSPLKLVGALGVGIASIVALLLAVGIVVAIGDGDVSQVVAPIAGVLDAIRWAWWFATAYGIFLVLGATGLGLVYLHEQGRKHTDAPRWLRAEPANVGASVVDAALDESMIMNALRKLGHSALNKAFKDGWGSTVMPTWVQPPLPVGRHGWEFALRLPGGVPATSINGRKEVLAHNLGRRPEEVWVDVDDGDPMAMKCLVLNPGALREPVPDYPLLAGGQTDFWTGFPVGIDARRNPVTTPIFERNTIKAGIMGSGKTSLLQVELAGAALDPLVDIDVFCFADNNDYEWLRPVASIVSMGDTAANVEACLAHITDLHASLAERGQLLREYGINSVTREVAEKDPRLRPRFVVIDECQSFFRQDKPEDRRELVNMMVRFFSAARKYGIVLNFATPTPSDQSLPRDLVAVTSNRACFAIGDKNRNNVVLGERAYENGLSALELKPAVKEGNKIVALNDVGTCVAVGYMQQPGLLRSYNLTSSDQNTIITRALELRGGATHPHPTAVEPEQQRDLLDDVHTALAGEDKVKATDVAARLRDLASSYRPYQTLNGTELATHLEQLNVKVTKSGVLWVYAERVRDALAHREGGNT
ncbi:S-DNA-T family DNA segregation ATPase FtsK/SpoIIIE [Tamaricihabitans halophyticus]|uniref:S-DNA-T family DNA segregation ATPase FtsK/SpoIIIE n=1 Tax=Tamaricihabitans halophyticus TaxID=1262583 RepID=A0A4V2SQE6_9PSEU|nr:FtsK/SpoIIIE domain-containing protein [Tamaricihabitans halophyticus]TCP38696.1 S-DNA-T family DNA segregation ATPase FtsK/SpoIIIE [Tamaricihabitans halophyticus]